MNTVKRWETDRIGINKAQSIKIIRDSEPTLDQQSSGNVEHFLVGWFFVAYYVGLSPFRLTHSKDTPSNRRIYTVHHSLIQRVFCGICQSLALIVYTSEVQLVSSCITEENRNPVDFLSYFFKIVSLIHHIVFIHLLWTKGHEFADLLNYSNASSSLQSLLKQIKTPPKWIAYGISLIFFLFAVLSLLFGNAAEPHNLLSLCDWAPKTRNLLFLPIPPDFSQLFSHFNLSDFFLVSFYWITAANRRIMAHGTDALILMVCLTLWYPSKALRNEGEMNKTKVLMILERYETLKCFSRKINLITRKVIFTFILEAVLFYSIGMKPVLLMKATGGPITILLLSFFSCFYLASDVCEQVDWIRTWLSDSSVRERFEDSGLVTFLIQELESYPISLSGNGVFVINHNLAKSICASLLTYFVVTVQFDNNAKSPQQVKH